MNIYLCLRQTEDWDNVSVENCHWLTNRTSHLEAASIWNNSFSMTWQKYRKHLQERAFKNWNIPFVRRSDVQNLNDDDVIIPIDDDDWIHPQLKDFVSSNMGTNEMIQWTQIANVYSDSRHIEKWGLLKKDRQNFCCSSDHCLRVGSVKECPDMITLLDRHCHVMDHFFHRRRLYIPEILTCYNFHLGSFTHLSSIGNDLDRMKSHIRRCEYIPDWAMWSKENIDWLDDLTMSLF